MVFQPPGKLLSAHSSLGIPHGPQPRLGHSIRIFPPIHRGAFWSVGAHIEGKPTFRFVLKFDIGIQVL